MEYVSSLAGVFLFDTLYPKRDVLTPEQQQRIIENLEAMLRSTSDRSVASDGMASARHRTIPASGLRADAERVQNLSAEKGKNIADDMKHEAGRSKRQTHGGGV